MKKRKWKAEARRLRTEVAHLSELLVDEQRDVDHWQAVISAKMDEAAAVARCDEKSRAFNAATETAIKTGNARKADRLALVADLLLCIDGWRQMSCGGLVSWADVDKNIRAWAEKRK